MKKPVAKANKLFQEVAQIINSSRLSVVRTTNRMTVATYYLVGMRIIEHEQLGKIRAAYAKSVLPSLSRQLQKQFGKGFSVDNLENMRKLYLTYSISESSSRKLKNADNAVPAFTLSWSHYVVLCRIKDEAERKFYEIEATGNNWSLEELQRQINAALYERLAISKNKKKVLQLSKKGQVIRQPKDVIKNPFILEFLGLEEKSFIPKRI